VFQIPYGLRPALWLAGAAVGGGLVTLLGWVSLRSVLKTPPKIVLQG
jgi:putative ABC transport system permease protein